MAVGSTYKRGENWWISFYYNGKQIRTSSKSTRKRDAERLLALYLGEIARGEFQGLKTARNALSVSEAMDDLESDFEHRQVRNLHKIASRHKPIRELLGEEDAGALTERTIDQYIKTRLKSVSRATVNRETQHLKQALKLAQRKKLITNIPYIEKFRETNVRQGFFEFNEIQAVVSHLPFYLKDLVLFAYYSGWRKGEITSLEWRDVYGDTIRLRPEISKTHEGRVLTLVGELKNIIDRRREVTNGQIIFHRNGKSVYDFRKSWATACKKAGVQGRLFHDLRRTAVRNMVIAGVPEKVAMSISGHRTREIFDRYHIVNEEDIEQGLLATQKHIQSQSMHN